MSGMMNKAKDMMSGGKNDNGNTGGGMGGDSNAQSQGGNMSSEDNYINQVCVHAEPLLSTELI